MKTKFYPLFPIMITAGVLLVLLSGCSWFESKEERSSQELANDAMEAFQSGNYQEAITAFEKLKDWYPFSKYTPLAQLKIADAHYELEAYEDAIFAYEEFENLHPLNDAIPYVVYRIGRCWYDQMDSMDRDQTSANHALTAFMRLKKQHPESPYAKKAAAHIKKCLKTLAGHEYQVGLYYYKDKNYKAALRRFKTVLTRFPDAGIHQMALTYIARCETKLAKAKKP